MDVASDGSFKRETRIVNFRKRTKTNKTSFIAGCGFPKYYCLNNCVNEQLYCPHFFTEKTKRNFKT